MFFWVVIILAIISILWAAWSLRGLSKDGKVTQKVKRHLAKGRVVFHSGHSSDGSSTSSK